MRFNIHIKLEPVRIKWFFQRLFRGYDDTDLWGLDTWIIKKIRKPFKAFVRKGTMSYPSSLAPKKWDEILKQIEEAIDLYYEEEIELIIDWGKISGDQFAERNKKKQKGMELFGKYFFNLWD